jgi:hypothetical protein
MSDKHYDVVVIGAGLAGLSVAGLMAKQEKKRVLVVEKENYLGGRMLSFRGRGSKIVTHMGQELDDKGFRKALASVYSWVHSTNPDLTTILEKKLLDGYGWECGGTVTFWGNKGRMACLLDYFGKHVDMAGNKGFLVIESTGKAKYQIKKGEPYGWMNEEQNRTVRSMLREMATADEKKSAEWERMSLDQWMKERTQDRKVYEYIAAVASIHMVSGEPSNIAMRDFAGFMQAAAKMGVNLLTGGATGIMPDAGFGYIGVRLAEVVNENDGEILLGRRAKQVLFKGNTAIGVEIETPKGTDIVKSEQVVCTLPTRDMFKVIPKEHFPVDFVEHLEKSFFSTGMLTAFYGLKSNILVDAGVVPTSWMLAPAILKSEEGFIGDVDVISTSKSNWQPSLAPVERGEHSLGLSIALLDHEMHDRNKVEKVIRKARQVFYNAFPTMEINQKFELWLCSDRGYGDWPPSNESRPGTVHPSLKGLFFAGDGYGSKVWGAGMDTAVHSALFCAGEMTGHSYVKEILPNYHR